MTDKHYDKLVKLIENNPHVRIDIGKSNCSNELFCSVSFYTKNPVNAPVYVHSDFRALSMHGVYTHLKELLKKHK